MTRLEISSVRYPTSLDITIVDLGRRGVQVALTDGGSVYRRRRWQSATLAAIDCRSLLSVGHRLAAPRALVALEAEAREEWTTRPAAQAAD